MKETGGRLSAGLACLIQCSLINDGRDDKTIRACERRCNVQYMSLAPVPWENGGQQFNVNGTNQSDWYRKLLATEFFVEEFFVG